MQNKIGLAVALIGLLHWMQSMIRNILCPNMDFKRSADTVNNEVVSNNIKCHQSVLCDCGVTGGILCSHGLSFVCSRVIAERRHVDFTCLPNGVRPTSLTILVGHSS